MSAAANDLQQALFQALSAYAPLTALIGSGKVFDRTPADVAFPYVTLGMTDVVDWSTATDEGEEHFLTLHVWSRAKGRKETLAVMEAIRARLHDQSLTIAGHRLVNMRQAGAEALYDEDADAHHGQVRLRAVTEAAA